MSRTPLDPCKRHHGPRPVEPHIRSWCISEKQRSFNCGALGVVPADEGDTRRDAQQAGLAAVDQGP